MVEQAICEDASPHNPPRRAKRREEEGKKRAYLGDDITEFLLHFALGALETLPQIVADAAALQQRAARLLGRLDLDQALNVLDGAAQQRGLEHRVGHRGALLALLGLHVEERHVDVALEVGTEPRGEVLALGWSTVSIFPQRERMGGRWLCAVWEGATLPALRLR